MRRGRARCGVQPAQGAEESRSCRVCMAVARGCAHGTWGEARMFGWRRAELTRRRHERALDHRRDARGQWPTVPAHAQRAGGRAGGRTLPPPLPSTADLCSAAYAHLIPLEVRRRGADVTQLRPHKSARAADRRAACSHDALRAHASRARLGRYSIRCLAEPLPHCGPIPFLLCGGA